MICMQAQFTYMCLCVQVPSRLELKQKNLVSISDVNMQWHPDGTYLCVKVDRQKSKKTTTYSFELFRYVLVNVCMYLLLTCM